MTDQPAPVHGCTIGGQPAIPVLLSEYQQLTADHAALTRVRNAAALHRKGLISTAELHAVIGPATAVTEAETTTRVFAALHQSAEQDVTRVIALYERWVKAGPPPLGTPIARWWDARLAELHDAILPPDAAPDVGGGA